MNDLFDSTITNTVDLPNGNDQSPTDESKFDPTTLNGKRTVECERDERQRKCDSSSDSNSIDFFFVQALRRALRMSRTMIIRMN